MAYATQVLCSAAPPSSPTSSPPFQADIGVDAGRYSKTLMHHARVFANTLSDPPTSQAPLDVLQYAYDNTDVPGSSTACVMVLAGRTLMARNLGDSGFVVLRNWRPVLESEAQLHGFNFPFQLTGPTPMAEGRGTNKDLPEDSQVRGAGKQGGCDLDMVRWGGVSGVACYAVEWVRTAVQWILMGVVRATLGLVWREGGLFIR